MNYSDIRKLDVSNGPGIRVTLFVSGCTHKCPECFNEDLQDFNYGNLWTEEVENDFLSYLDNPIVVGVNILGGEPLQQLMDDSLLNLLKKIKEIHKGKSIWLWTGDLYEDAIKDERKLNILKFVDVLVDGRFLVEERDLNLKYRGSRNQRVIDIKKSLESGVVIELDI